LRNRDPAQIEWVQSFYQLFRDLAEYVKQYFPNGIPWNAKGQSAADVAKSISTSGSAAAPPALSPPAAGGAPPPPPPPPGPPPVLQIKEEAPSGKDESGFGAVFGEINKGSDVTKGLRKVDKSQMTHKNPSLRAKSTGSETDSASARGKSPAPGKKPKPESMRVKKPPKKVLDGTKWTIVRKILL
jgi:adenylyl cyclase-associated protein